MEDLFSWGLPTKRSISTFCVQWAPDECPCITQEDLLQGIFPTRESNLDLSLQAAMLLIGARPSHRAWH